MWAHSAKKILRASVWERNLKNFSYICSKQGIIWTRGIILTRLQNFKDVFDSYRGLTCVWNEVCHHINRSHQLESHIIMHLKKIFFLLDYKYNGDKAYSPSKVLPSRGICTFINKMLGRICIVHGLLNKFVWSLHNGCAPRESMSTNTEQGRQQNYHKEEIKMIMWTMIEMVGNKWV